MSTWISRGGRFLVVAGGLATLAACDQFGDPIEVLSGKVRAPDEFVVVARKPLQMPSSVRLQDLPEPTLGGASPRDPNPQADAARALLGTSGASNTGQTSAGEAALLGATNAAAGDAVTEAALKEAEARTQQGGTYRAPSVFAVVGLDGETIEDALDADAEARRLQSEGVSVAPVNPNAQATTE